MKNGRRHRNRRSRDRVRHRRSERRSRGGRKRACASSSSRKVRSSRRANTYYAQGGIVSLGPDDDPELLREDIIKAGDGISNPEAVDILAGESKAARRQDPDRRAEDPVHPELAGETRLCPGGGPFPPPHSSRQGHDGQNHRGEVHRGPEETAERHPLDRAYGGRPADRSPSFQEADRLLPASRGASAPMSSTTGRIQSRHSSPTSRSWPPADAGRSISTPPIRRTPSARAMPWPIGPAPGSSTWNISSSIRRRSIHRDADSFLISETVRGEGARLKTRQGRTFMEKYSDKKDLAPRDEVTRAIYEEMINSNSNYVLLDLASYAKVDIKKRFPNIYKTCLKVRHRHHQGAHPRRPRGALLLRRRAGRTAGARPRSPASMRSARSSCTGLHGANRLASTSLLEGLVWGTRAARQIAERFDPAVPYKESEDPRVVLSRSARRRSTRRLINQDWLTIRTTMWNYAGIIRHEEAAGAGQGRPGISHGTGSKSSIRKRAWRRRSSASSTASKSR